MFGIPIIHTAATNRSATNKAFGWAYNGWLFFGIGVCLSVTVIALVLFHFLILST